MRKQSGFTLIELLLVLAIIGIISAIAVPALLGQRERAKAQAVKDNAIACIADLASTMDTLSEPPSERPSIISGGVNLQTADTSTSSTRAAAARTFVLGKSNFTGAKNPYTGVAPCFIATDTDTPAVGNIHVNLTNVAADGFIRITGAYKNPADGNTIYIIKDVAAI